MSAALAVLPVVWAVERPLATPERNQCEVVEPEVAFYRKYTEAMLRRYVRFSMESGRVPSLLGKEMFRSKVTNCRIETFDDVIIFVHDVEKCLEKLDEEQQRLILRIALQQYTLGETAEMMGLKLRTVIRRYSQAVDRLTRIFLNVRLLEPQKMLSRG